VKYSAYFQFDQVIELKPDKAKWLKGKTWMYLSVMFKDLKKEDLVFARRVVSDDQCSGVWVSFTAEDLTTFKLSDVHNIIKAILKMELNLDDVIVKDFTISGDDVMTVKAGSIFILTIEFEKEIEKGKAEEFVNELFERANEVMSMNFEVKKIDVWKNRVKVEVKVSDDIVFPKQIKGDFVKDVEDFYEGIEASAFPKWIRFLIILGAVAGAVIGSTNAIKNMFASIPKETLESMSWGAVALAVIVGLILVITLLSKTGGGEA